MRSSVAYPNTKLKQSYNAKTSDLRIIPQCKIAAETSSLPKDQYSRVSADASAYYGTLKFGDDRFSEGFQVKLFCDVEIYEVQYAILSLETAARTSVRKPRCGRLGMNYTIGWSEAKRFSIPC
jgi:hypothetical protein